MVRRQRGTGRVHPLTDHAKLCDPGDLPPRVAYQERRRHLALIVKEDEHTDHRVVRDPVVTAVVDLQRQLLATLQT